MAKPRWTVDKGPRVHEAARLWNVSSKDLLTLLKVLGITRQGLCQSSILTMPEYLYVTNRFHTVRKEINARNG